jgi:hypothetical protein
MLNFNKNYDYSGGTVTIVCGDVKQSFTFNRNEIDITMPEQKVTPILDRGRLTGDLHRYWDASVCLIKLNNVDGGGDIYHKYEGKSFQLYFVFNHRGERFMFDNCTMTNVFGTVRSAVRHPRVIR